MPNPALKCLRPGLNFVGVYSFLFLLQADYKDVSRDFQRTPMQWTGERNAGFSTHNSTWLPVSPDYPENNVKV